MQTGLLYSTHRLSANKRSRLQHARRDDACLQDAVAFRRYRILEGIRAIFCLGARRDDGMRQGRGMLPRWTSSFLRHSPRGHKTDSVRAVSRAPRWREKFSVFTATFALAAGSGVHGRDLQTRELTQRRWWRHGCRLDERRARRHLRQAIFGASEQKDRVVARRLRREPRQPGRRKETGAEGVVGRRENLPPEAVEKSVRSTASASVLTQPRISPSGASGRRGSRRPWASRRIV